MFEDWAKKLTPWLLGDGPQAGIVLSTRVRLARNIGGLIFPARAGADQKKKVLELVTAALAKTGLPKGKFITSTEVRGIDRDFLVERHLISPEFMREKNGQGVFISENESINIMVNEEDHLRIQAIKSGFQLRECYREVSRMDKALSKYMQFEHDSQFGFLTSCPTNVGTGLRGSVLIHLPGLVLTRKVENLINKAGKGIFTVRGFYGEGSDVAGNLFQISNQNTLGRSEEEILTDLEKAASQIIEEEVAARESIFREAKEQIEDKIWRSYGILRNARLLSSSEVMNLLSALRLGVGQKVLGNVSLPTINEVLFLCQPAHLQKYFNRSMNPEERDVSRAELVRTKLVDKENGKKKRKKRPQG
ncbi:MAG: protein arginine kinase [candidate division Zixibacteria bacterium]|nr:protein arginine kinase [candidate division Zixibacteria bacterium]